MQLKKLCNCAAILIAMVIVSSSVVSTATTAWAQTRLTYTNFAPAVSFPAVQMERWKTEVEKRTNGKVKIDTFPGGTLITAKNTFDGVVSDIADIGCLSMSYQPGRFPVAETVDLPLGFTSAKVGSLVLYDLIEKYSPKEFEKVKLITLFTNPPMNLMTKTPVRSLADIKGLELRVAGTGSEILRLLGGIPVAMPATDTPEALQKGVVKGVISSFETLKQLGFAAYCPYTTVTNLHVVGFAVAMNKEKWNSLPPEVKSVIDGLSREQALWTAAYVDDFGKESIEWSKQKYDHQVLQLPDKDKAEIARLLRPIVDDHVKKINKLGLPGDQILKDVLTLKDKYEKQYK